MQTRTKIAVGLGLAALFFATRSRAAPREGFVSPAPGARITSGFGPRTDPITGEPGKFHNGIDFGVPIGTPLVAPASGQITFSGQLASSPASGNTLGVLCDGGVFSWSFSHLSEVLVRSGRVEQGQVVALSGNTGTRTTGPHLHFKVSMHGEAINPLTVVSA